MAEYETYAHKGKDYKFRVGRETPKLEMFELLTSDHYQGVQKELDVVVYQIAIPPFVLFILWLVLGFANVSIEENLLWILGVFAIAYFYTFSAAANRISDASKLIGDLKEKSGNEEYMEAYKAWMKDRVE